MAVKIQWQDDVRRFTEVQTLEGLLGEAQARFAARLAPWLTYHDGEGETIKVSTTSELREAIRLGACDRKTAKFLAHPAPVEEGWEVLDVDEAATKTSAQPASTPQGPSFVSSISVTVNGKEHALQNPDPSKSLADFLRNDLRLTGTKVACDEGGCGACTVAAIRGGSNTVISINACLRPLCAMDGWSVTTVEGLSASGNPAAAHASRNRGCCKAAKAEAADIHPLPKKLADGNGVQCGFCSPGWVMNMYSLLEKNKGKAPLTVEQIEQNFDGNLCRCTGYRPIVEAFSSYAGSPEDFTSRHRSVEAAEGSWATAAQTPRHFTSPTGNQDWYTVFTLQQLRDLLQMLQQRRPGVKPTYVASNTGLKGVLKYCEGEPLGIPSADPVLIDIHGIQELSGTPTLTSVNGQVVMQVGAAVSLAAVIDALDAHRAALPNSAPEADTCKVLADHLRRIAGVQVRNAATWAGNLALARSQSSFTSDLAPTLAALGASLTVASGDSTQTVSVEDYVLQRDGAPSNAQPLILQGQIPLSFPSPSGVTVFRAYKTAQRHVLSHSIVNGAFLATLDSRTKVCLTARLFFGGLSKKAMMRASVAEAALEGKPLSTTSLKQALAGLRQDLEHQGLSADPRYSADYRLALAKAHLYRFCLEATSLVSALPADLRSALLPFATAASRPPLQAKQDFQVQASESPVSEAIPKLTAVMSAAGKAVYPSDHGILTADTLYGAFVISDRANCRLLSLDPSEALAVSGVVDFIGVADVPRGKTLQFDEPLFHGPGQVVPCEGAALGFVLAETLELAKHAALKVRLVWDEAAAVVVNDIKAARQHSTFITKDELIEGPLRQLEKVGGLRRRGLPVMRANFSLKKTEEGATPGTLQVSGSVETGGQVHFYMEPQTSIVIPSEDGLEVWSGDQDPAFNQMSLSELLDMPSHKINVRVRRVGGAFGGKLARQVPLSASCAIAALKWRRPVFGSNERVLDQMMTQGREPITADYTGTYNADGRMMSLTMDLHFDGGWFLGDNSGDLAMAVQFSDNVYYCPTYKCNGVPYTTHTPHRTSQRAPGVVQGITAHEVVLEHVGRQLGIPFEDIQERNFYQVGQVTPWGDKIGVGNFNWTIPQVWQKLRQDSNFDARKVAVDSLNQTSRWRKRGIAMVPVKYGMGLNFYNSLAVVNIYGDGSVLVAHGGCEVGQGIHTKVAQVVAFTLGIDLSLVRVADTETSKAPNNTCTGGSGTSECTSAAARMAAEELVQRLAPYRQQHPVWADAVAAAKAAAVCLSAEGWYVNQAPPPNSYATYGAAVSEVEIDLLTGEMEIVRVDILMDQGWQLNAFVDIGQLEGGFVMALGYFFTEQVLFAKDGKQLNVGTWHYKIPSYYDTPQQFNVSLLNPAIENPGGVLGSKASAEPVMSLAASAYFAVKYALYAAREQNGIGSAFFNLPIPATVENIRAACRVPDDALYLPA